LECDHWREILEAMGHKVTFVAGALDRAGILMPELHFQAPSVMDLHDKVVYAKGNYRQIEANIFDIAGTIEGKLRHFFNGRRSVDLLIVANALSLPMHFPLAVALSRVIEELNLPSIARHHDFWWERKKYLKSHLFHFFERWFPPKLSNLKHVVINSIAREELKKRTGIEADVIWDSFDFKNNIKAKKDRYSKNFRNDFEIERDDLVFLQATRIVPRKRVEMSVDFIKKLNNPKSILILAGHTGDEGKEYYKKIYRLVRESKIRFRFIGDRINSRRRLEAVSNGKFPVRKRIYTLWDCYKNVDFILYPTKIEGFGNQFVESIFFKKPIIMTPYPVYRKDIEPLGFETIIMLQKVTQGVIRKVESIIENPDLAKKMTEKNYELGKKYMSYEWVEKKLKKLITKN